jgi:hypothetical protein
MGSDNGSRGRRGNPGTTAGSFWFAGWLSTIAFPKFVWWKALLALILWPYFLGVAVR